MAVPTQELREGDPQTGENRYYHGPVSDHFDGNLFFNPDGEEPRSVRDLLRWRFHERRAAWPLRFDSPFPQAQPEARVEGERLRLTMVGHATLLIQTAGCNILTDPVWSERTSPVPFAGPKRVNPPGIAFTDLPPIDLVLLSHNHYDHLDVATLRTLRQTHDPLVVTPLGNDRLLKAADSAMRVATLDWGGQLDFNGLTVHATPAHHWSARALKDRRMALWAAFVVETEHDKIYHVGDTGFDGGRNYRAAADTFGGFRLAILPIGCYEPRWFMKEHHQTPEEALEGMRLAGAAHLAGHHWGTFHLANEIIDEPSRRLTEAARREALAADRVRAMAPGECWDVPA